MCGIHVSVCLSFFLAIHICVLFPFFFLNSLGVGAACPVMDELDTVGITGRLCHRPCAMSLLHAQLHGRATLKTARDVIRYSVSWLQQPVDVEEGSWDQGWLPLPVQLHAIRSCRSSLAPSNASPAGSNRLQPRSDGDARPLSSLTKRSLQQLPLRRSDSWSIDQRIIRYKWFFFFFWIMLNISTN